MPSKKINDAFYKSRILLKEMTLPLIDDEYEDDCYELAYCMSPVTKNIFELQYGPLNETDMLKLFLKNIFIYNEFKAFNESEISTLKMMELFSNNFNLFELNELQPDM